MTAVSREQIFIDIKNILDELNDDWEYSGEITSETWFSADLGFESIDVVAFGNALEEHYRQPFPFAEYLGELGKKETIDLRLGDVVDLIYQNLKAPDGEKKGE